VLNKLRNIKEIADLKKEISKQNSLLSSFLKTKSIFVHIPKTAGVSVVKGLYGEVKGGGHPSAITYRKVFKNNFKLYFKFCFVRNPYDRLYSAYNFMKKGGLHQTDANWADKHINRFKNFEEFVLNWVNIKNIQKGIHFKPQTYFICNKNGELLVDFVGKMEQIEEDFNYIANKLSVTTKLEKFNVSNLNKININDVYNKKMKEIVYEVYKSDFDTLLYDKNF
jgi:hypothetical protein